MSEIKGKRTETESKLQEKILRLERERDAALARLRELEQAPPSNAEAELRTKATMDLLEGITEGTEDLIAAKDTNFRLMFSNKAFRKVVKDIQSLRRICRRSGPTRKVLSASSPT